MRPTIPSQQVSDDAQRLAHFALAQQRRRELRAHVHRQVVPRRFVCGEHRARDQDDECGREDRERPAAAVSRRCGRWQQQPHEDERRDERKESSRTFRENGGDHGDTGDGGSDGGCRGRRGARRVEHQQDRCRRQQRLGVLEHVVDRSPTDDGGRQPEQHRQPVEGRGEQAAPDAGDHHCVQREHQQ